MLQIKDLNDVYALMGRAENDEFEAKKSLISKKDMVEKILSFANGEQENGYIILGVSEDADNLVDAVVGVQFPFNMPQSTIGKFGDFNRYKRAMFNHLKSQAKIDILTPNDLEDHLNSIVSFKPPIPIPGTNKVICIIEVKQSEFRPIFNDESKRYHRRYSETSPNRGDACSRFMPDMEIYHEMLQKHTRLMTQYPVHPIYNHESFVPHPDLARLFDLIYRGKDKETFELIENHRQLLMMVDSVGNNALHIAVFYERTDILIGLLDKFDMSAFVTNTDGWTPFTTAVYIGNLALAEYLLERHPVLLKNRDRFGYNAFLVSILYDQLEITGWLYSMRDKIRFGQTEISLDVSDSIELMPLSLAAYGKSKGVFEYLLKHFDNSPGLLTNNLEQIKKMTGKEWFIEKIETQLEIISSPNYKWKKIAEKSKEQSAEPLEADTAASSAILNQLAAHEENGAAETGLLMRNPS